MNYSDTRITLDLQLHQAQVSVSATLNDTARRLCVGFTDGRKPYVIAEGCTATFAAKKPDGLALFNACTIENNTVIYEFTTQTANVIGTYECEIRLYNEDGKQLTSPRFLLVVDEQAANDDDIIDSFTEVTALNQIIANETERIVKETERLANEETRKTNESQREVNERMRAAYEESRNSSEYDRYYAETVRQSNEETRISNENTRSSNENTRNSNENTRSSNEASRNLAEGERNTAENTRQAAEQERAIQEYGNGYYRYDPDKGCVVDFGGYKVSEEVLGGRVGNERIRQANEETRISNDSAREARLQSVETKVNNLNTETNNLSSRTSAVEGKTNGLEMDIGNHTNSIASLQTNVQTIDTNMGALGERVSKNEKSISNLNTEVQNNSQNIQTNVDQIGYINDYLNRSPSESENIFLDVYPIGSIYMSVNSTSPATLFGGSWTQLKNRFLVGAGGTYGVKTEGGATSHSHGAGTLGAAATMTGSSILIKSEQRAGSNYTPAAKINASSRDTYSQQTDYIVPVYGSTASENYLPPYYAVYMWRRDA